MTKYQLAKLISFARNGTVESRKRIQKIVCLLQAAGMRLTDDFRLHQFGPYSCDVATLLDDLSAAGILEESEQPFDHGVQYRYSLSHSAKATIKALEAGPSRSIRCQRAEFSQFKDKIKRLFKVDELWLLELGSTMAYYRQKGMDWDAAAERACQYKKYPIEAPKSKQALQLAKEIIE